MLVSINPFKTNMLGLYIYELTSVSYNIHVQDNNISDFGGKLYNEWKII